MAFVKESLYNTNMHLTIYSKYFIIASIVLLSLKFLNHVSRQKQFRYARFLKRQKNVRFKIIEQLSKRPDMLPDDLTSQELAGVLILISGKQSVAKSLSTAIQFADSRTNNLFNEDFFANLFAIAKRFQNTMWIKESLEVMNLGKMIAGHFQNAYWKKEFQEQIRTLQYYRTGNATTYASDKANLRKF